MKMMNKVCALLVSAALCAGMAAPALAFEGDTAPVEQPVLPEVVEEDVVTVTDEESGALTPEGNWAAKAILPSSPVRMDGTTPSTTAIIL